MAKFETKALVEGALFSAITVVLSLFGFYLPPPFGIAIILTLPVPIIILGVRQGSKTSILSTIISAIILGIIVNPFMVLIVLLSFGLTGVVLGAAFEENFSPFKIIAVSIVTSILSTILIIGVNLYFLDFDVTNAFNTALEQYKQLGLDQATMKQLETIINDMQKMFKIFFPSIILAASSVKGLINYYIALPVLNRLGYDFDTPTPFARWRLPKYIILGYILGILLISNSFGKNIYFIFNFVYLIQGLAVAAHYLKRLNISNVVQKVILFILAIIPINQILAFVGILDQWFDFRKLED
ncbi:YybS family protein [Selenihalanaerobacter shriftii]|uniref:Uncharacterized conserved protein YybS, DUF2232 family n=1 Tax=Selenihalanaerobacter shriftii TaxID=142842 RepID=A0A1T4NNG6_9FIRM|nr:YybS family protein [Selenihalanaerobacter shriftii]SJZ80831.1 Uncharacterized conserved protein YybS, DUF2232 family [Selenihalanaerobacter shriftii]